MGVLTTGSRALVLDADALSAFASDAPRILPWTIAAARTGSVLYTSTLTLTEVTDGGARDVGVRRAARTVRLRPVTAQIGYAAGALRAGAASVRRKPRDLTVDAVVAATALDLVGTMRVPVVVLTSDPGDLQLLLAGSEVRVETIG